MISVPFTRMFIALTHILYKVYKILICRKKLHYYVEYINM